MLFADASLLQDIAMYNEGVCCFMAEKSEIKQFENSNFSSGRITIRDPETLKDYSYLYTVVDFPRVSSSLAQKKEKCVCLKLRLDTRQPSIKKCHSVFTRKQMIDMGWILK